MPLQNEANNSGLERWWSLWLNTWQQIKLKQCDVVCAHHSTRKRVHISECWNIYIKTESLWSVPLKVKHSLWKQCCFKLAPQLQYWEQIICHLLLTPFCLYIQWVCAVCICRWAVCVCVSVCVALWQGLMSKSARLHRPVAPLPYKCHLFPASDLHNAKLLSRNGPISGGSEDHSWRSNRKRLL